MNDCNFAKIMKKLAKKKEKKVIFCIAVLLCKIFK